MADFSFLKHPEIRIREGCVHIDENNIFDPISDEAIRRGEDILGQPFPDQLKDFYRQIGYGHLTTPCNAPKDYRFYSANEILYPEIAARFAKGILEWEGQTGWMSRDTYERLEPGDLPFFEIGDSSSYLVMKLNSDNPNAVWSDCGVKIEDSFERFIWRLYYENPGYYGDVITQAYGIYIDEKGNVVSEP